MMSAAAFAKAATPAETVPSFPRHAPVRTRSHRALAAKGPREASNARRSPPEPPPAPRGAFPEGSLCARRDPCRFGPDPAPSQGRQGPLRRRLVAALSKWRFPVISRHEKRPSARRAARPAPARPPKPPSRMPRTAGPASASTRPPSRTSRRLGRERDVTISPSLCHALPRSTKDAMRQCPSRCLVTSPRARESSTHAAACGSRCPGIP